VIPMFKWSYTVPALDCSAIETDSPLTYYLKSAILIQVFHKENYSELEHDEPKPLSQGLIILDSP